MWRFRSRKIHNHFSSQRFKQTKWREHEKRRCTQSEMTAILDKSEMKLVSSKRKRGKLAKINTSITNFRQNTNVPSIGLVLSGTRRKVPKVRFQLPWLCRYYRLQLMSYVLASGISTVKRTGIEPLNCCQTHMDSLILC